MISKDIEQGEIAIAKQVTVEVKGQLVVVSESPRGSSWRLAHDGKAAHYFRESTGVTSTKLTLFIADTEKECRAEADRLTLDLSKIVAPLTFEALKKLVEDAAHRPV